jgi:hypothetical protein
MPHRAFACLLIVTAASAYGAESPTTAAAAQLNQKMLAYELTLPKANSLIAALKSMTAYVVSLPNFQERLRNTMKMTAAERVAQIESDPKAMSILRENDLSVQEYLVGVPALRNALLAAQGAPGATASAANVAFAKAHLAELKPEMDAADGLARPQ